MKTSIKLAALAFILAAGFPCAALAEQLGAHIPSTFDAENMIGLFSIVSLGLLLVSDYSRTGAARAYAAAYRKASTETHRLAA
jgi:hypothetical protein